MSEIPTKPYLLRALYEWCVDNGYTPHLAVKVDSRTQVPPEHVRNGEITLNVAPTAVHKLQMGNEVIEFSARFAGVARQISVPVENVYALYARETGHGMTFEVQPGRPPAHARGEGEPAAMLVSFKEGGQAGDAARGSQNEPAKPPVPAPSGVPEPPKPGSGGRPPLRRVK
jgi:stringent starvation protein B